jgi:hypothetical protein
MREFSRALISICVVALFFDYLAERGSRGHRYIYGTGMVLGALFLLAERWTLRHPVQLSDRILEGTQSKVSNEATNWPWKPDSPKSTEPSSDSVQGPRRTRDTVTPEATIREREIS